MKTVIESQTPITIRTTPKRGLLAAYFGLSLLAIFCLPYFFQVRPSLSESYVFGYNNRVGLILFLLLASIAAIWTKGFDFEFSATGPCRKVPLKYLWLSLAVELVGCAGMYFWAGRRGIIGEPEQQINRIWLVSLGKMPYIDFEWPWGPFPLYMPKWISDLFHLSIAQGYFLFWAITSLVGILLLYATINLIDFPCSRKIGIFFLFLPCAVLSILNLGSNYTWVRYLCPLFFILIVHKVDRHGSQRAARTRAAMLGVLFTGLLLLISPEVAIAHAFSCIVLLRPEKLKVDKLSQNVVYLATIAALAIVFAAANKAHFFDALRMDADGGNSFPIAFAPAILLFFGAAFVCACYVAQRASNDGIEDNTIALISFSIPMTAAALGRCDPGHVLMNGIGFFLAALFYASNSSRMWKICRNAFIFCFLLATPFYGVLMTLFLFSGPKSLEFPKGADISALYPRSMRSAKDRVFEAPFGYAPNASGFYFSSQIDYGFYDGNWDAVTPQAYRTKVSELAEHPQRYLLLPKHFESACEVSESSERLFLGFLFAFPYTANAVHRESVRKPLCEYIFARYVLAESATAENFNYELWTPKL